MPGFSFKIIQLVRRVDEGIDETRLTTSCVLILRMFINFDIPLFKRWNLISFSLSVGRTWALISNEYNVVEVILCDFQDYIIKVIATSTLLFFGSFILREASHYAMRLLQQLYGKVHVARNRCLMSTPYQP